MPRSIAEIRKAIDAKEKMAEKNKTEGPKTEKEITDLATLKIGFDGKISKEKEPKKKQAMEIERDKIIERHKAAKIKQATMEKAVAGIEDALKELDEELKAAIKGVEDYGKARQAGLVMLDREGKKLKVQCDAAKEACADAEKCSRDAEAAAKKGDENGAQGARNNANNAVMRTIEAARKAKEAIGEITTEMTATQRNLKAATFGVVDSDIVMHNQLTKKVQELFKVLEHMAHECPAYVKDAEAAAAEATEFANAVTVGGDMYGTILDKAMLRAQEQMTEIKNIMGAKWGGYITKKGELFTRVASALAEKPHDPGTRSAAEKAVEQGQTYLAATMSNVNGLIQALVLSCRKATQRVPGEYQRALKPKVDKLNMVAIQIVNYQKKVQSDYDATETEFQKLVTALQ